MVKLIGPLHSDRASKQIGKNLIFKTKQNRSFATSYSKPGQKKKFDASPAQLDKRMLYNLIIACWQCKTDNQRAIFNDEVKSKNLQMSGWNLFYQKAITDPYTYMGLAGYWSFNKIVNGKIPDLSGNENNGILKPTYPSDCPVLVNSFKPKFGKAGLFNGSTDYIDCGNDASLDITDAITISAWVKSDTVSGSSGYLISKNDQDSNDNQFAINTYNGAAEFIGFASPVTPAGVIPYNVWTHVVFTRPGGIGQFYINGQTSGNPAACNMPSKPTFPVRLGCRWAVDGTLPYWNYKGLIDEVCIYNRALSEEEILKPFHIGRS